IRRTIVLGDQTADRYAPIFIEQWQHRLPDRAANILEINVDAVWAGGRQLGGKIGGTVIDRRVEAQFVSDEGAFLRTAGNADRPGAGELGQLADERPDRSARRRDHHGFTGLRLANGSHAAIGGESRHAEHARPAVTGAAAGASLRKVPP